MVIVIIIVALLLLVGLIYVLPATASSACATVSTRPGAASTSSSSAGTTWSRTWSSRSRATPLTSRRPSRRSPRPAPRRCRRGPRGGGQGGEAAHPGPGRPAGGRRAVPRASRHRELPAAPAPALRAGGRDPGLTPDLQLERPAVQHADPAVPRLDHRQPGRLHRQDVLRDRRRRRARDPAGLVQPVRAISRSTRSRPPRGSTSRARRPRIGLAVAIGTSRSWAMRSPRRALELAGLVGVQQQHTDLAPVAGVDQPG